MELLLIIAKMSHLYLRHFFTAMKLSLANMSSIPVGI